MNLSCTLLVICVLDLLCVRILEIPNKNDCQKYIPNNIILYYSCLVREAKFIYFSTISEVYCFFHLLMYYIQVQATFKFWQIQKLRIVAYRNYLSNFEFLDLNLGALNPLPCEYTATHYGHKMTVLQYYSKKGCISSPYSPN